MSLPITALFTRSLRVESRQLTLYLARLALLVVIGFYLLEFRFAGRYFGAPGLQFFTTVVYINLVFITLAGMSYFASAITEEKEEMTLGLLRMTRLNPVAILLGKSTARMLGAILLLVVQFPFTLLAVTLGGVAPMQIVAAYATLLAYVVLVSGLALCCSVVCTRNAGAGRLAGGLLLGFLIGVPMGRGILGELVRSGYLNRLNILWRALGWVLHWMFEASPFIRVGEITRTGFSSFPAGWQVASNVAAGALFFLAAWAVFEFFTRQQKEASPARGLLAGGRSRFRLFSPGRTWRNALAWKDFNFTAGGASAVLVKFVVFGGVLVGIYLLIIKYGNYITVGQYCFVIQYVMGIVLLLELASYMAHVFNEEVKWQTLPTVVMLPITIRSLAYRKVAGTLLGLIPSATYALLAAGLSIREWSDIPRNDNFWYVVLIVIAQSVFFVHLTAYLSLALKRGALAAAIGIWYVGMGILLGLFHGFLYLSNLRLGQNEDVVNFIFLTAIAILLTVLLHWQIGRRLAKVAGSQ